MIEVVSWVIGFPSSEQLEHERGEKRSKGQQVMKDGPPQLEWTYHK